MLEIPFQSYSGDENYIFVSYAHADAQAVFPELKRFYNAGYPVWYDQGLVSGQEWVDEIAKALLGCSLHVVFISRNSVESYYVTNEINLSLSKNKAILPIYLEDVELPPSLELFLSSNHAILEYLLGDEDFERECFKAFEKAQIHKVLKDTSASKANTLPKACDDSPYIYVSYRHADSKRVYPMIEQFQDAGFNVWYDDGSMFGPNYEDIICDKIEGSSLFVVCITEGVIDNANNPADFMKSELSLAVGEIPICPIYLDDVKLKSAYRLHLAGIQSIFRFEFDSYTDFIDECLNAFERDFSIKPNRPATDSHSKEHTDNQESITIQSKEDNNADSNVACKNTSGGPYIFVSYKRVDSEAVRPMIRKFQDAGFDVWYDDFLQYGSKYEDIIQDRIVNSSLFVFCITENVMKNAKNLNEYPVAELNIAKYEKIPVLPIYMENVELKSYYFMHLAGLSSLFKYEFGSDEAFIEECVRSFEYDFDIPPKHNKGIDKTGSVDLDVAARVNSDSHKNQVYQDGLRIELGNAPADAEVASKVSEKYKSIASVIGLCDDGFDNLKRGDVRTAAKMFNMAIRLDEDDPNPVVGQAYCSFSLGYYVKALEECDRALELESGIVDDDFYRKVKEKAENR